MSSHIIQFNLVDGATGRPYNAEHGSTTVIIVIGVLKIRLTLSDAMIARLCRALLARHDFSVVGEIGSATISKSALPDGYVSGARNRQFFIVNGKTLGAEEVQV